MRAVKPQCAKWRPCAAGRASARSRAPDVIRARSLVRATRTYLIWPRKISCAKNHYILHCRLNGDCSGPGRRAARHPRGVRTTSCGRCGADGSAPAVSAVATGPAGSRARPMYEDGSYRFLYSRSTADDKVPRMSRVRDPGESPRRARRSVSDKRAEQEGQEREGGEDVVRERVAALGQERLALGEHRPTTRSAALQPGESIGCGRARSCVLTGPL